MKSPSCDLLIRILIFKRILALTDGRDKLMKVIQYTAKFLLWKYPSTDSEMKSKAKIISSQFSTIRKVIRLAHFLEPLNEGYDIMRSAKYATTAEKLAPLGAIIGICNDISDDLICLSKIGLIAKEHSKRLTPISDRLWLFSIFIDIQANLEATNKLISTQDFKKDPKAIQKVYLNRISLAKLISDLIFCTVDVFEMDGKVSPAWQIMTGLLSASLGTMKLYIKNK